MADIVTRLQDLLDGPVPMNVERAQVRDALDEIERLRAQVQNLDAEVQRLNAQVREAGY